VFEPTHHELRFAVPYGEESNGGRQWYLELAPPLLIPRNEVHRVAVIEQKLGIVSDTPYVRPHRVRHE
jgi:hypothetical protein